MKLVSKMDQRPYMNVMFGNFYCPAYTDKEFIDKTMKLIKKLGYNSVMFDTKAWEDFKERYEKGSLSQYVEMQEYMGEAAHKNSLAYNFLVLYLNGDNLYPNIRFSPPIIGEGITYLDGTKARYYKYWSRVAQKSMIDHVERVMKQYGKGCERCQTADGKEVIPICSMWDPVVAASFDEEGQNRYKEFLKEFYNDDIKKLNSHYELKLDDFSQITPYEYCYSARYKPDSFYTEKDLEERTPRFYVWRDNQYFKIKELTQYFREIGPKLKENNPDLFLCPNLSQWGYFFNIYGRKQVDNDNEYSDLWDSALRGIDMYAISQYVDSCHFITVPITPDGYPDAYVVSAQHSMMRVMNEEKAFIGGIYWGRYIYNDIYAHISPTEIIGSMAACGMEGYHCYGMNGLDDGGVMNRMDESFLSSLQYANEWFAKIYKKRVGKRKKEIAILFPMEMSNIEPFEVGNNKIRRLDLLGWYKICCDYGYQADIISYHEIENEKLSEYKVLIIPTNSCYFSAQHDEMEEKIKEWVINGGVVLHGPRDELAKKCFGIIDTECEKIPYEYGKVVIAQGERFSRFSSGEVIAPYIEDKGSCIVCHKDEELANKMQKTNVKGAVYSFGIQIGASYTAKNIPHVPYEQGNKEMYPFIQSKTTVVKDILLKYITPLSKICERGVETGVFENGMVIVNHRPVPYVLPQKYKEEIYQYKYHNNDENYHVLAPGEAVWVEV